MAALAVHGEPSASGAHTGQITGRGVMSGPRVSTDPELDILRKQCVELSAQADRERAVAASLRQKVKIAREALEAAAADLEWCAPRETRARHGAEKARAALALMEQIDAGA